MDNKTDAFPLPCIIKEALEKFIKVPLVFNAYLKSWRQLPNSIDILMDEYGKTLLDFRIVPYSVKEISWEGNAQYIVAEISQFIAWQSSEISSESPFYNFPNNEYWAYSSYNYMNQIFPEESNIMQHFNWKRFGFPNITGKDSTFWIGSKEAYTPCHVDSYGFNLVGQLLGRKKWILFPPDDEKYLYPMRIPYEESSIFSSVNMLKPDLSLNPNFKNAHPHAVILEEGDVLFVPKGWWHFVCCLDPITVSINSWIELESDIDSRLLESTTKTLITSLISSYEPEQEVWVNPKEELVSPEECIQYMISTLRELKRLKEESVQDNESTELKIPKTTIESDVHSHIFNGTKFLNSCQNINIVQPSSVSNTFTLSENSSKQLESDNYNVNKLINCFVHPDVIKLICQKLSEL